jgi:biopolymer transport protein ExbB
MIAGALDFIRNGGPIMYVLAGLSLVAVAFIVERGWVLRWGRVIPVVLFDRLDRWKSGTDNVDDIAAYCRERNESSLCRMLVQAIDHVDWPREENADQLQARARMEVVHLERGLVALEIVVGVAPLLGLVGTIQGLMQLFAGIGDLGEADGATLAAGIAIALNTTMAGMVVAIPAMVFWSYFNKKVETMAIEMEGVCDDFLRTLYRRKAEDPEE